MWDWAIWGALAVAVLAGLAATAVLVKRVLEGFRELKRARREAAQSIGELAAKGEATAEKAAAAGDTPELQESVARLRVSLARLAVLQAAIDETEDAVGRLTSVVPRK